MLLRSILLLLATCAGYSAEIGLGPLPAGASIYSGGAVPASGQVIYSNGTALAGDAGNTYDATNDTLIVNHNGAALPATPNADEMMLQIGGKDATATRIIIDGFGGGPNFTGRRANGTNAAKTGLVNNDTIVALSALGYEPTSPAYTTGAKASLTFQASETWSSTANGTKFAVNLTPAGGSVTNTAIWALSPTIASQTCTDAVTNTGTVAASWNHITSGTPAAGFGTTLQVQGWDDGAATLRVMSQLATTWVDAASATRSSRMNINVVANAAQVTALAILPTTITATATDAATATASTLATFQHATTGTAANGFGGTLTINGVDDGGTQRGMALISTTWTTAASATRASKITFAVQVAAVSTVGVTINPTSVVLAALFPLNVNDTTNSSSVSTGSIITPGGIGCAKNITFTGTTGASLKIITPTANAAVAVTLGSTGPTGSTAGAPQGWVVINVAGTDRFMPFWLWLAHDAEWRECQRMHESGYPAAYINASRPYERAMEMR